MADKLDVIEGVDNLTQAGLELESASDGGNARVLRGVRIADIGAVRLRCAACDGGGCPCPGGTYDSAGSSSSG
jgi:hypothetical protein